MVLCISIVIQKNNLDKIKDSKNFGLMIDKSTNVNVTGHVVVFAIFVHDGLHVSIFNLLEIANGRKDAEKKISKVVEIYEEMGFGS
jgi:hypothetical protein